MQYGRKGKIICFITGIIIFIGFTVVYVNSNETEEIHAFTGSNSYCAPCHGKDKENKTADPAVTCSDMCLTCHKEMQNHHAINIRINEKLPEGFLLAGKKRITCVTCHNLKTGRFDNSSWKAESLYEKVFKDSPVYKTYFLVIKNNNGQLCKTCH